MSATWAGGRLKRFRTARARFARDALRRATTVVHPVAHVARITTQILPRPKAGFEMQHVHVRCGTGPICVHVGGRTSRRFSTSNTDGVPCVRFSAESGKLGSSEVVSQIRLVLGGDLLDRWDLSAPRHQSRGVSDLEARNRISQHTSTYTDPVLKIADSAEGP